MYLLGSLRTSARIALRSVTSLLSWSYSVWSFSSLAAVPFPDYSDFMSESAPEVMPTRLR